MTEFLIIEWLSCEISLSEPKQYPYDVTVIITILDTHLICQNFQEPNNQKSQDVGPQRTPMKYKPLRQNHCHH